MTTEVRITNKSHHPLPAYATAHSAGMDLRANLDRPIILEPGQRALIPTGLFLELPEGTEAQVRPRSGLAFKHGITVLNSPGTIDADYRGEVGVLLINHGHEAFNWSLPGTSGLLSRKVRTFAPLNEEREVSDIPAPAEREQTE